MTLFNSPLEAFLHWEKKTPDRNFINQPIDGTIKNYTFKEAGTEARKIAKALQNFKLPEHSHIALLSKNCAHWILADLAIMMSGHVSIPIYPTLNSATINQILVHSDAKAIIIGKLDDLDSQKEGIPNIHKISVGVYNANEGQSWETLVDELEEITNIQLPDKDDLYTIIYTSGTTGNPKGAMHTYHNCMVTATTGVESFSIPNHPIFFSYLPLAHVAERMIIGACGFVTGAEFNFAESLQTFASDLEKTQPSIFFAVPRIWTKFQEKILETVPQKRLNFLLALPLINRVIKNKLKHKLGLSNARLMFSGAAPIATSLLDWYEKIGITILQGYGMTEDCIVSHGNLPHANKKGTVGKAMPGVSIKLTSDGEICIKNDCLMKGYYKAPEITAGVFTDDGYFKTGDIGEYDHDGFLTITGRVKDQFKTDKGKYISPTPIELALSENTDIEQICVVGTGIPQPIALVTLSELGKKKSTQDLSKSLTARLAQINPKLAAYEKIEKIVVMKEDWTIDNGLITPTLKVKRNSIEKIHREFYKSWFEQEKNVIFE